MSKPRQSYHETKNEMVKRLTDTAEREFGIPRDVAYKGAVERAERAMEGVVREHERTGVSRPTEIRSK